MRKNTDAASSPDFALFLLGIEQKYKVPLNEVLDAVTRFGISRGKIQGYFEVQSYLKKKGLTTQQVNDGMVHRWFPA
ncbi:hypothetical protein [Sediminibacterium soli]|uniref:hypothetical protein n=1 Tax=Sediminibacterium soli TaxID=2698829 RepID=UPI0013797A2E|nr:hypothetical protein [Sediminibacterium soli]NCI48237.1 hypothetical protein [Sediminibacterium soli]